jgi:pimeloyl-ACP methyl ester carboxylesterase
VSSPTIHQSLDVREIVLDADGIPLSGLLAEPRKVPPLATVVAVHGGGVRAGYFHGRAHPSLSLLTLGSRLGYSVLAVDRPGYGLSAARLPDGQGLREQSDTLHAALEDFTRHHPTGAGLFLLGHSYGGKLALTAASDERGAAFLGLDVSGVSHRYAVAPERLSSVGDRSNWSLHWGPLGLYPPGTFRLAGPLLTTMPAREMRQLPGWPQAFPDIAARIRVPIRFTFAEYERWWRHDPATLAELTGMLTASPEVTVERMPHAGHNISLGWAARAYHLRAIAFLESLLRRE